MNARRMALVVAVSTVLAVGATGVALAAFSGSASTTMAVSSATLQPPGQPTATVTCRGANKSSIALSWAASPSAFVAGYTVTRSANGGPAVTLGSTTTTTWTDTTIAKSTTYVYDVIATYRAWSSPAPTVTATTTNKC
jgi:hypothetical protein